MNRQDAKTAKKFPVGLLVNWIAARLVPVDVMHRPLRILNSNGGFLGGLGGLAVQSGLAVRWGLM
jgi:hypothetical protein